MKRKSIIALLIACLLFSGFSGIPAYATDESTTDKPTVTQQPAKMTAAQKQAALIKKYGTYKGKNAKRIPVLTYHRFSDKKKRGSMASLYMPQKDFDKQMRYLKKKGYRTINCDEFYLWYKGKIKLPKKSVLITFDDGHYGVAKYAYPVLKKYNLKATCFVIGKRTKNGRRGTMRYKTFKKIQKEYPNLEFQSHTWALHKRFSQKGDYKRVLKDAKKQKSVYNFKYLAYPYGRYTKGMIRAYKKAGIKMAFTYGKNAYATRNQSIYKIKRIKISGIESFSKFKRWVR